MQKLPRQGNAEEVLDQVACTAFYRYDAICGVLLPVQVFFFFLLFFILLLYHQLEKHNKHPSSVPLIFYNKQNACLCFSVRFYSNSIVQHLNFEDSLFVHQQNQSVWISEEINSKLVIGKHKPAKMFDIWVHERIKQRCEFMQWLILTTRINQTRECNSNRKQVYLPDVLPHWEENIYT